MSESTLLRLLGQHATACWMTECSAILKATNYVVGNQHKELYHRTRAVVMYDRCRDVLAGRPRNGIDFTATQQGGA